MSSTPALRVKNQPMVKPTLISSSKRALKLVAIRQDDIRFDTVNGPVDARLIRIMQLTSTPAVNLHHRQLPPQYNFGQSTNSKPPQLRSHSESKNVRSWSPITLRAVGEVLSDDKGKLYEMRDQELHLLGRLVRNQAGRLFEICGSTETKSNPQTEVIKAPTALSSKTKIMKPAKGSSTPTTLIRRVIEFLLRKFAPLFANEKRSR